MGILTHFPASLSTPTAGFGAVLTMVGVGRVFFTLSRAGFADVGAKLAHVGCMGTTAGHK